MRTKILLISGLVAIVALVLVGGAYAYNRPAAQLQRSTARFQQVEAAVREGYARFKDCMSDPQRGAMGIHYVNGSLLEDAKIDLLHPESVIYEPQADGGLKLVGVEYIVFVSAWDTTHTQPPTLMGQKFGITDNPALGVPPFYALHVWAWRDNPSGLFASWNPKVSCPG